MRILIVIKRLIYLLLIITLIALFTYSFDPNLYLSRVIPAYIQNASTDKIVENVIWRIEIYFRKMAGGLPGLYWNEIIKGTWPKTGFINPQLVAEGRSLDASIGNRRNSPQDITEGERLFRENCAPCHGKGGTGDHARSLTHANYSVGSSDFAIYKTLRDGIRGTAMAAVDLTVDQRWQVIAYLRSLQRKDAAKSRFASNIPTINVSWGDIVSARTKGDAWLTYSGTLDGKRHTKLTEINRENVSSLKLAWVHQFNASGDMFEATPIVSNGVIFISEPPGSVVALDARTGNQIWKYERPLPNELPVCCGRVNRGLAILGDNLFFTTLDARLIALDARTGDVKWETKVADPADGYSITAAPLVVKDLVVVGISGGEFGIRGFLSAFDADTGELRWHFNTIPGPGEYGHETWENDAWKTGGGPTWITGAFDPELNTLYWGVGNPAPDYAGDARPGDNLFTNSVVALDAATGKLRWHFQFTPHDEHDWDSNQTPVLADISINGSARKVICWANRNGFYYLLDRTNGEFLTGAPFVEVNWASGLDGNGRPILTKNAAVTTGGVLTKPWVGGGTNWQPPAFDPESATFFLNATDGSSIFTKTANEEVRRGQGGFYVGSGYGSSDPGRNFVKAIDAASGKIRWSHIIDRVNNEFDSTYGGMLSTQGGVVYSSVSGKLVALDSATGDELWRANLGGITKAPPISFTINGHQVIAVIAGKALFVFGL